MNRAAEQAEGTSSTELLQAFVNTREPQTGTDQLVDPAVLGEWFESHGLLPARISLGPRDLERTIEVREGLRALFMTHAGHDADPLALDQLNRVFGMFPVGLHLDTEGYVLAPSVREPLASPLAHIADAIRRCHEDGTWPRLKVCARDTCRWAFYDASRNMARRWCSMAGCGNHVKMKRAYARRVGSAG